jgi:hypothetical protein
MKRGSLKAMEVQLTSDQKAAAFLLTLDDARASIARGEGRELTQDSMRQLADGVKERGRARLLAESDSADLKVVGQAKPLSHRSAVVGPAVPPADRRSQGLFTPTLITPFGEGGDGHMHVHACYSTHRCELPSR